MTLLMFCCVPLCAVRSVILTVDATEAWRAGAGVAVDTVGAVGSVLTRVALTLVDVLLALCSSKTGQAGAQEAVHLVLTEASVAAGVWRGRFLTQLRTTVLWSLDFSDLFLPCARERA